MNNARCASETKWKTRVERNRMIERSRNGGAHMATWQAFADSAPGIAELGLKILSHSGAAFFLATVRKDGSPRLHPVVPIVADGKLFVFCGGPKVYDLRRDGRYSLHAQIDRDDIEFLVEGRAAFVNDDKTMRAAVARAAP